MNAGAPTSGFVTVKKSQALRMTAVWGWVFRSARALRPRVNAGAPTLSFRQFEKAKGEPVASERLRRLFGADTRLPVNAIMN